MRQRKTRRRNAHSVVHAPRPARGAEGFMLLEMLVAMSILGAILGCVSTVLISTSRNFSSNEHVSTVRQDGVKALDRILRELRGADRATLLLQTQPCSQRVDFRVATGYDPDTGTTLWGPTTEIRWEASDIDANGNGTKTDDGRVVLVKNGRTEILSNYVKSGGLQISTAGSVVQVCLELNVYDKARGLVNFTFKGSTALMNSSK